MKKEEEDKEHAGEWNIIMKEKEKFHWRAFDESFVTWEKTIIYVFYVNWFRRLRKEIFLGVIIAHQKHELQSIIKK